jgi:hypothetical protein
MSAAKISHRFNPSFSPDSVKSFFCFILLPLLVPSSSFLDLRNSTKGSGYFEKVVVILLIVILLIVILLIVILLIVILLIVILLIVILPSSKSTEVVGSTMREL